MPELLICRSAHIMQPAQFEIKGTYIEVLPISSQRMIFANKDRMPYFMAWNNDGKKWEFTHSLVPHDLKIREGELSDVIIRHENKK